MLVLYGATIAWGLLGTALALWLVKLTESALDVWWTLSGIFGGGITGLFLLGMISRRAKNPAAVTGVVCGAIAIFWLSLPKLLEYLAKLPENFTLHRMALDVQASTANWSSPFHTFLVPVFGTLAILLVGIGVSELAALLHRQQK